MVVKFRASIDPLFVMTSILNFYTDALYNYNI